MNPELEIAYLWDPRQRVITAEADRIDALDDAQRAEKLMALSHRVAELTRGMDDGRLVSTAYFMVEDLFKSCFQQLFWTPGAADYIRATAGAVLAELTRRDFVLHYIIDNQECEAKLLDRVEGIPLPFWAAGLEVVGPQMAAFELMEKVDGRPRDARAIPQYRAEGHECANEIIQDWHRERRHSVYLNMDLDDDAPALSLDAARSVGGEPGAIVIVRNEAPTLGSFAHILPPPGVTLPRT